MPPRLNPPSLRRHAPSRQAVVTLNGHDHYLGPWPDDSRTPPDEPRSAYDALIAQWLANGRQSLAGPPPLTVADLILQFWDRHFVPYYRHPDGTPTSERDGYPNWRSVVRIAAASLSVEDLQAVRAVEVAERIGTADAVMLLRSWAGGAEGAALTVEAQAALNRLAKP